MTGWPIEKLWEGGHQWPAILLFVMSVLWLFLYLSYLQPQRHPSDDRESKGGIQDRQNLARLLKHSDHTGLYKALTLRLLRWGDLFYAGVDHTDAPDRGGWKGLFFTTPDSNGDFLTRQSIIQPFFASFAISLAYAFGAFVFSWGLLGGPTSMGSFQVFEQDIPIELRIFSTVWLLTWPVWVIVIVVWLGPKIFRLTRSFFSELVARYVGFFGTGILAVNVCVAITVVVVQHVNGTEILAFTLIGAGAISGLGTVAGVAIGSGSGTGPVIFALLIASLVFLIGGFSGSIFIPVVTFLLALPLTNALLDWVSRAFSRRFMRFMVAEGRSTGLRRHLEDALCILADFALGIIFLLSLIAALIYAMDAVIALTGTTEFEWRSLAATARDYPFTQGFAVTFMLFTTLLPTLIHVSLHIFALSANLFAVNDGLIAKLESETAIIGAGERRLIAANLTLRWTFAALIGLGGIFGGLFAIGYIAGVGNIPDALYTFALCISDGAPAGHTCLGQLTRM